MKWLITREEYDALTRNNLLRRDACPFCDREEQTWHTVWKGKYWYILRNLFPYSWDQDHLMATPYEHKAFFHDLTNNEISELKDIHDFMKEYFGNKDYFSSTRETLANRSVEHYHMHFIPGKLQGAYLRKMLENQGFPIHEDLDITKKMD